MILFFKVFFAEFIAEMGDKTQLMLIALTSKYKLRDIILGTGVAILVLNGLAVLAGGLVSEFVPEWVIKMIVSGGPGKQSQFWVPFPQVLKPVSAKIAE